MMAVAQNDEARGMAEKVATLIEKKVDAIEGGHARILRMNIIEEGTKEATKDAGLIIVPLNGIARTKVIQVKTARLRSSATKSTNSGKRKK